MTRARCFDSLLEASSSVSPIIWKLTSIQLTHYLLESTSTEDLLAPVIDTFHRHATVWTAMDVKRDIISALNTTRHTLKLRGMQSRPLLGLLVEFDGGKYLSDALRDEIAADVSLVALVRFWEILRPRRSAARLTSSQQTLQPHTDRPLDNVPDVLPEILMLANDPRLDAPQILADGLWIKYRMSSGWAWKVWDNTFASLRQVPAMTSDLPTRRIYALRYGEFLRGVDQHLPVGLDGQVLRWFLGQGKNEMAALSADSWDVVIVVLIYLSVHNALRTTSILEGLVYPAWNHGSSVTDDAYGQSIATYLRAANNLCHRLLVKEDCDDDHMPPASLLEVQCLRTRRQDVYREPHFPLLITNIPVLVLLENNPKIPSAQRKEAREIRQVLCEEDQFRRGVYRNLDKVRDAFERSLQLTEGTSEDVSKQTASALKVVLGETADGERATSTHVDMKAQYGWQISN